MLIPKTSFRSDVPFYLFLLFISYKFICSLAIDNLILQCQYYCSVFDEYSKWSFSLSKHFVRWIPSYSKGFQLELAIWKISSAAEGSRFEKKNSPNLVIIFSAIFDSRYHSLHYPNNIILLKSLHILIILEWIQDFLTFKIPMTISSSLEYNYDFRINRKPKIMLASKGWYTETSEVLLIISAVGNLEEVRLF